MLYFPCSTWIKKDVNGADQLWGIRDLTDFHRQAQCCLSSQRLFLQQSGQADCRSLVVLIDPTTKVGNRR